MEKKTQKKQQTQRKAGEMTFGVIVENEVFPFSMTTEQLDRYQKSLKTPKQSKK